MWAVVFFLGDLCGTHEETLTNHGKCVPKAGENLKERGTLAFDWEYTTTQSKR